MRIETETFELRDNDMRELTYAETNEVAGGVGTGLVQAVFSSGAGSSQNVAIAAAISVTNTTASAAITSQSTGIVGANNSGALVAIATR
jgi:hypothetical protein